MFIDIFDKQNAVFDLREVSGTEQMIQDRQIAAPQDSVGIDSRIACCLHRDPVRA